MSVALESKAPAVSGGHEPERMNYYQLESVAVWNAALETGPFFIGGASSNYEARSLGGKLGEPFLRPLAILIRVVFVNLSTQLAVVSISAASSMPCLSSPSILM
jgi:hypothetical protein